MLTKGYVATEAGGGEKPFEPDLGLFFPAPSGTFGILTMLTRIQKMPKKPSNPCHTIAFDFDPDKKNIW